MASKQVSRRRLLKLMGAGMGGVLLAACQPEVVKETVVVEKEKEVEKVVKETVEVETEVTREVEVEGEAAPLPEMEMRYGYPGHAEPYVELCVTTFEAQEPNVDVNLEVIVGDYTQKVYAMATSGTTPDVLWISDARVLPFAVDNVMLDMNPLAEADDTFDASDIYPIMKGLGEYKGGWYMMPWAADAPVMYYNKTMLEDRGLNPPEDPLEGYTVQEFQETCGAVTDEDKTEYGWFGNENWWAIYVPWIEGFGGTFYNEEKSEVLVNSPEAVEACQALADIYVEYNGAVPKGADFGGNPMITGNACFHITNRNFSANLRKAEVEFEWDVAVPPRQPVEHVAGAGTMGPGVSAPAAERGTETAAWKLASMIAKPATQKHLCRQYLIIPVLMSMEKDPSWYELDPPPANRDVFLKIPELAITPPQPNNNECGTVYVGETEQAMSDAWEEMVVGEVPAQEALDKAAESINECIERGGA